MKKIPRLYILLLCLTLLVTFQSTHAHSEVNSWQCSMLLLLDGAFLALIMVLCILGVIISALLKKFKMVGFFVLFLISTFISRSVITVFFDQSTVESCHPPYESSIDYTQGERKQDSDKTIKSDNNTQNINPNITTTKPKALTETTEPSIYNNKHIKNERAPKLVETK